ncbi:MAG TPA: histidine kinase [Burkholderiaceae bacterium]|jgi:sensor histidine kinase YesM
MSTPPPILFARPGVRAAVWVTFWALLFMLGVQEYLWSGGHRLWQPVVDYGTAALAGTLIANWQLRRARRLQGLLGRPLQWFIQQWKWMPLQALGFVAVTYGMRIVIYRLAGLTRELTNWGEIVVYESAKFVLFYLLLSGVQFGALSYRAWVNERLRAEQQARLAQEAQLAQLTQQLQPHFLFNALNTISSLIHTDPDLADTLLTQLASLLRAATDASRRLEQPLTDELALLRAYASIMTQRFADRVRIEWAIDAAALACPVPTLALQPLLENCFRHVVERRRAPTRIAVRARRLGATLCIEIEDDGDPITQPPVFGVGLGNLQRRLESLHGERARLSLNPQAGGGLVVRVELPCAC